MRAHANNGCSPAASDESARARVRVRSLLWTRASGIPLLPSSAYHEGMPSCLRHRAECHDGLGPTRGQGDLPGRAFAKARER